jgi:hypothetical protein
VDKLFRDVPTVVSAFNPPAAAVRVETGWKITGQVPFASGCQNACQNPGFEKSLHWLWTVFLGETTVSIGIADAAVEQAVPTFPLTINNRMVIDQHGLSSGRSVQDPLRSHS